MLAHAAAVLSVESALVVLLFVPPLFVFAIDESAILAQFGSQDDEFHHVGLGDQLEDDLYSDSDSSMEASRNTDEHRSPGRANTKKNPTTHGLGPRDHEARPHSVLVPSASTLTRDTAASAPPFHTQTKKGEFCDGPGVVSTGA